MYADQQVWGKKCALFFSRRARA